MLVFSINKFVRAVLLSSLASLFFFASAYAETLIDWRVQGLPSNLGGVSVVALPVQPADAAGVLLHKLENQGYPLAEVRIAPGRLVVTFGEIVEVDVTGFEEKIHPLIHSYLDHFVGTSPTTDQLSHALALIDDIPGVAASIRLVRLDDEGHYKAVASGVIGRQSGVVSVRNTPTLGFESREVSIHQEFYSALIAGDILRLDATTINTDDSSQAHGLEISHEFPLDNDGTFLETRVSHFRATSGEQFEPGQSEDSDTTTVALVVGHAFTRFVDVADYVYGELDYRTEDNGDSGTADYAVGRAAFFESRHQDDGTTLSWSVSGSAGRELSDDDSTFGVLKAGGGVIFWLPQVFETAEMRIEASAQIGTSEVPGFELFSFGGAGRQRGFSPFEYAGNHGADLTIEAAETFQPWSPSGPVLTPYLFTDATFIANSPSQVSESRPRTNTLLSAGFGSKISFLNGFSIDSWIATPLHDGERSDRGLGVEFYLQGQFTW
jgi:hemolysin activation/secretion protein